MSQTWEQSPYHTKIIIMRKIHTQENVEPTWKNTGAFLEFLWSWSGRPTKPKYKTTNTHKPRAACRQNGTWGAWAGPNENNCPSTSSKHHKYYNHRSEIVLIQQKEEDLAAKLSPWSLCLVSLRNESINGQTAILFDTISTKCGMFRSFVRMTLLRERTSSFEFQHPSADWWRTPTWRRRQNSQTPYRQYAAGIVWTDGDRRLGKWPVFDGTHCPDNCWMPLPGHLSHQWALSQTRWG